MKSTGLLHKMSSQQATPVIDYALELGGVHFDLTYLVGQDIGLIYTGKIVCANCGKLTKKSYGQGFCYPCTTKLAACDLCIVKPETCHFSKGTCREPEWGKTHCMQAHVVYLANSSGLKVGITRRTQVPTRWIDQGATSALPILEVDSRLDSGLIEVLFKKYIADKTDWRKMLKGAPSQVDLLAEKVRLLELVKDELTLLPHRVLEEEVWHFEYPVQQYPEKVSSLSFDKTPEIKGRLLGIKGQYLILDIGVLNVRAHTGYEVTLEGEQNAKT
jgi:hypothetical protein